MNLFELQERLKDFSKDQLVKEMQMPSGSAPPYLVLSELQRRTRMEQAMKADGQQAPQSTVAEDMVAAAGVPQGGLGDMARAMAPQTDMVQNDAAAPVQQMAEGGQVETNDDVGSAIQQAMGGGGQSIDTSSILQQLTPAAQRLGITAQGLSQAAAQPMQQMPTTPAQPQFDSSRIDDILARLNAPQQAAPLRAPTGPADFTQRYGFDYRQVYGPDTNWGDPQMYQYGPMASFPRGAQELGPPMPNVSEADLAYVMNNAPTMEQRQAALDAMKRLSSAPQQTGLPWMQYSNDSMGMAEGGVVRGDRDMAELYELAQNAPWELGDDDWQRLYGKTWSFMKRKALAERGGDQPEGPMTEMLLGEEMALRNQARGYDGPALSQNVDTDVRAAAEAAYPDGRGNTAPYPTQPSIGSLSDILPSRSPENLGLAGVINPEAAVLGSGEMAAGHPLPDRLLNIPGAEQPVDRGRQYAGAMRNLVGLSEEGRGLPAQLAAEDALMAMPLMEAVPPARSGVDTTDDARAARGFGRSSYLSGLLDAGDSASLPGLPRPAEQDGPRMAMSAGEVGAPRPSMVPDFVTDPETEMDIITRQSAEDAAKLRDEADIDTSLRSDEEKAAAAEAAREINTKTPTAAAGTSGTGGGGSGGTSVSGSAVSESESEGGDNASKWLALARFGLGLMQSQQPTFGGAVGEAGMAALDELRALEDREYEREMTEREFALKQQIAAMRGRGGGGRGSSGMPSMTSQFNALMRSREDLDTQIAELRYDIDPEKGATTEQQQQLTALANQKARIDAVLGSVSPLYGMAYGAGGAPAITDNVDKGLIPSARQQG